MKLKINIILGLIKLSALANILLVYTAAFSQSTKLNMQYEKINNQQTLELNLFTEKENIPISDAKISLFLKTDKINIDLGKVITDLEGKTNFVLSDTLKIPWKFNFLAVYAGSSQLEPATKELSIKNIDLDISFKIFDDKKYIIGKGYEMLENGDNLPLNGKNIYFFSQSLFGLLPLGSGHLENGECKLEFPKNLPGDTIGNLKIIAKIIDDGEYGNVSSEAFTNWAEKKIIPVLPKRQLWTKDPPLWMFISLFILLAGAWSHYIFVFRKMIIIKKLGKEFKEE